MKIQIKDLIIKFHSRDDNIISNEKFKFERTPDDQISSKDSDLSKITKKKKHR
jgi:hypothetical protein